MGSNSKEVISFVRRRKAQLISIFGGKCCICGFDKYQQALEFHHVNPEEKEFGITVNSTTKALDLQINELRKCILVCSNCHRGIHGGFIKVPDNYQEFFNEEVANKLMVENYNKRHATTHKDDNLIILPKYTCKSCGAEITKNHTYCVKCAHELQQRVERPDRQQLKELIRTVPFTQIGKKYNVDGNSIRKWCDKYSLPRTKKAINSYSDEEWENI